MSDKNFKACETCKSTDCPSYNEMMSIGSGDMPHNTNGKRSCNARCPLGMVCTLEDGHDLPHVSETLHSKHIVALWNAGYFVIAGNYGGGQAIGEGDDTMSGESWSRVKEFSSIASAKKYMKENDLMEDSFVVLPYDEWIDE